MIYSCNKRCAEFFNRLPSDIRAAFMRRLGNLQALVKSIHPDIVITSAFRRPQYSRSLNGNCDSLHGYGLAIDVRSSSVRRDSSGRVFPVPTVRVVDETDHIHFEVDE